MISCTRTYELLEGPEGATVFKRLFCGVDRGASVRGVMRSCHWFHGFHESIDSDSADFSHHLYAAVQEARCALDLAEEAGDDPKSVARLKAAPAGVAQGSFARSIKQARAPGRNFRGKFHQG